MADVSSPFWQLWVNNIEITERARACITGLEFDYLCDGSDQLSISITDPDFIFIEDNIFIVDASVVARYGFVDDTDREEYVGFIAAIDISFPEDGSPTLTITCMDNSHVMNRVKKNRTWDNVSRADVVRIVAAEYGYSVNIEPNYDFQVQDTISQSNQTDIEFLEGLAGDEREPFMCKITDNTIIYTKKGLLQSPVTEVGYKTGDFSVMSFGPQITKETRKESVTDSNVTTDKTVDSHTATDSNVERDVQGESMKNDYGMMYDPEKRKWIQKKE